MNITGNEPAHPHPNHMGRSGMSIREYYAGLAMQGVMSSNAYHDFEHAAQIATQAADALINALNKQP